MLSFKEAEVWWYVRFLLGLILSLKFASSIPGALWSWDWIITSHTNLGSSTEFNVNKPCALGLVTSLSVKVPICWLRSQRVCKCLWTPGGSLEELCSVSSGNKSLCMLFRCVPSAQEFLGLETELVNLVSVWGAHPGKRVLFLKSCLSRNSSLLLAQMFAFDLVLPFPQPLQSISFLGSIDFILEAKSWGI